MGRKIDRTGEEGINKFGSKMVITKYNGALDNNKVLNRVLNRNDDDPLEYLEYKDLVKLTVMFILNDIYPLLYPLPLHLDL